METKRENLLKAMQEMKVDLGDVEALQELLYTATETGIIDCAVGIEDMPNIIRLVCLAAQYRGGRVPESLRM